VATDDERRRVAERLRSLRDIGGGVTNINHGYLWSLLWAASGEELSGSDRGDWFERFCARLADLIDPDTTSDRTKTAEDTTKCDREALLVLADEMDEERFDAGTAASDGKVRADRLSHYARRIREALGVDDG
jgi:hypothetical protein